ncbi:hypothetical protein E2C01_065170 [Portunus trituberculatus]|uniref:Uncharacterized protein n=1 Tax=Portunus trituberculatus TaxID=210409 RepID=A0A5B7HQC2_PORTR|nr:hypothetical protein [Portunus trituberculatus]
MILAASFHAPLLTPYADTQPASFTSCPVHISSSSSSSLLAYVLFDSSYGYSTTTATTTTTTTTPLEH